MREERGAGWGNSFLQANIGNWISNGRQQIFFLPVQENHFFERWKELWYHCHLKYHQEEIWVGSGWRLPAEPALEAPLSGELGAPTGPPVATLVSPPVCVLPPGHSQAPRGHETLCGGHPVLWDSVPETNAWLCLSSRPCPVGLPRGSRPGLWTRAHLPEAGPGWAWSWTGPSCKCRPWGGHGPCHMAGVMSL